MHTPTLACGNNVEHHCIEKRKGIILKPVFHQTENGRCIKRKTQWNEAKGENSSSSARRTSYTGETNNPIWEHYDPSNIIYNVESWDLSGTERIQAHHRYRGVGGGGGCGWTIIIFFWGTGTLQHVPALTMFRNDDHTTRKQVLEHMKPHHYCCWLSTGLMKDIIRYETIKTEIQRHHFSGELWKYLASPIWYKFSRVK